MDADRELQALMAMADGTLVDTRARVAGGDPARIARLILREVAARTTLFEPPATPVTVQFELSAGAISLEHCLTLGSPSPSLREGRVSDAPVRIRQELAELVRAVYGTGTARHDATRVVWIMNEPGPDTDDPQDPWMLALRAATIAAGQVTRACSGYRVDLGALARRFGSDKWGDHFYTGHYERHLAEYRDQRLKLLEIGVGGYESPDLGGESLRMWKYYFRRGLIYGLDVFDKSRHDELRVKTLVGDQSDPAALTALAEAFGPFDIVIDDGSHLSEHVITSFTTLFPALVDGGLYVIEDLQTSYWPGWNGHRGDPNDAATTVGYLKTLVDGLHHQDQLDRVPGPPAIVQNVRGLHLYHNIAFVEKGVNQEQTAPSWVRRDTHDMELMPKGSMRRTTPG